MSVLFLSRRFLTAFAELLSPQKTLKAFALAVGEALDCVKPPCLLGSIWCCMLAPLLNTQARSIQSGRLSDAAQNIFARKRKRRKIAGKTFLAVKEAKALVNLGLVPDASPAAERYLPDPRRSTRRGSRVSSRLPGRSQSSLDWLPVFTEGSLGCRGTRCQYQNRGGDTLR